MEKVLVTGATGFIGLHCVQQLLEAGYAVRGTVRSLSREQEVRDAMTKAGTSDEHLELVEADLMSDAGWPEAVTGCDYVMHVASPFIKGVPKDEDELIQPAVQGTERALSAAINAGVKKVVLTSSCAAIVARGGKGKTHFTEDDWTDTSSNRTPAYYKSKTLAEQRAWELVEAQTGDQKTELSVINPAGVVGPMLSRDIGTSNAFIAEVIKGEVPGCPKLHLGFVDVRDVASAHLAAMTRSEASGERFIISERELWFKEISDLLREAGYEKSPTRVLPTWLVKLLAIFSADLKQIAGMAGQATYTPADKARKLLGWQPRNVEGSLVETANQLLDEQLI